MNGVLRTGMGPDTQGPSIGPLGFIVSFGYRISRTALQLPHPTPPERLTQLPKHPTRAFPILAPSPRQAVVCNNIKLVRHQQVIAGPRSHVEADRMASGVALPAEATICGAAGADAGGLACCEGIRLPIPPGSCCRPPPAPAACADHVPVCPKPPSPRAVSSSSCTSSNCTAGTAAITIWAMRIPRSIVNGSCPRLITGHITCPR